VAALLGYSYVSVHKAQGFVNLGKTDLLVALYVAYYTVPGGRVSGSIRTLFANETQDEGVNGRFKHG
jgi:hypothetical protein